MPTTFQNACSSGTESWIDLKPRCKFEFVRCLEVYTKFTNLDHQRALMGKGHPRLSFFYGLPQMKKNIPLEPKIGLISTQALNFSLSII